jgi:hypothetical protein
MKDEKRAPVPPWREAGLLSLSRFISYCAERGIKTNKDQLEFYDRMNLLTPAVIVFHPFGEFMKIQNEEGKDVFVEHDGSKQAVYYHSGGVGFHGKSYSYRFYGRYAQQVEDDSLKYYEHFFPAMREYVPWSAYAMKNPDFVTDLSELGTPAEIYYSPEQIFPLIDVQHRYVLAVKDAGLFREQEKWLKLGEECKRIFAPEAELIRPHVEKKYKAIETFYLIDELWFKFIRDKAENFEKQAGKYVDGVWKSNELSARDFDAMLALWEKGDKKTEVEKILKAQKVTTADIRSMAELFVYKAFFTDPNIEIFEFYRTSVPLYLVQKQKGAARLCEDYYRIIERLLWALAAFEDQLVTLEDYYRTRGHRFMETCLVCGKAFKPSKNSGRLQRTCADPECVRVSKNVNRNKKRQEKRAKSGT